MSLKSQQVAKTHPANHTLVAPVMLPRVRGSAGNHTLMRKLNTSVDSHRSLNQPAQETLSTTNGRFLQRKCACGGSCEECKKPKEGMVQRAVQTKLAVSSPGDRYEQEADRVAEQVMTAPVKGAVESSRPRIQRFAGHSAEQADFAPKSVDSVLTSQGRPLNPSLRQDMQQRFGFDFSQVRVHSGAAAERSAREVNAHAYTVGHDIVFGPGRFAPATPQGRQLIAHELTHVVQQSGAAEGAMTGQVQRKVVDDDEHLPCRHTPGRFALLKEREQKAATIADGAAVALRSPANDSTHERVWRIFRRNYNDSIDRCRFIPEIAERFTEIAEAIRNTESTYICSGEGEPTERCKGRFAYTYKKGIFGSPKFDLCSRFWNPDNEDQQAPTILHEWVHDLYGLEDEQGGFETPECYSIFANEIAGDKVRVFEDSSKCDLDLTKPPDLDRSKVGVPCPLNLSFSVSALGKITKGKNTHLATLHPCCICIR